MRPGRVLTAVAWTTGLLAAVVVLAGLSRGGMAPPPLDPRSWGAEAEVRGPVELVFAVALLATRVVAWYLLGATALTALASMSGRGWLTAAARRVSVPLVERVVAGALGLAVVGAGAMGSPGDPGEGFEGRRAPALVLVASSEPRPDGDPPVMHRLGPDLVEGSPAPVEREEGTAVSPAPGEAEPVPIEEVRDPAPAGPAAQAWEVDAGDHLWSVAERVLHDAWGRAPSDREVAGYWARLVEDNRPRLADPANPDLVFPGQVLALPAPPPAS